jgi:hypothetical protein
MRLAPLLTLAGLWAAQDAFAGRPLLTDDAGVAEHATCQVESWSERQGPARAWVTAPACGVAAGVELGADYTLLRPRDTVRAEAGLALKWVPEAWKFESAMGEINWGLKLSGAWQQPAAASWQATGNSLMGLISWKASESVSVHSNIGWARDRSSGQRAALFNAALVWTPLDRLLLVAEVQGNGKRDVFGGTVLGLGARWWLIKDSLGLDLTSSRESVAGAKAVWTLGLGWYGIGL